jgi:uncharacterized protein YndB with AHSA1/START domain
MMDHPHASENKRTTEAAHGAGDGARIRLEHVTITTAIAHAPEIVFDAFSSFARYDLWAPEVQGACHWLLIQAGGVGSRFLAYDKPGRRHLTHEGVVTELERPRRVAWNAPFGEWPRAHIGSEVDFQATAHGTRVQETVVFWCAEDDRGVLEAFLQLKGFDAQTYASFLRQRHAGLARLLDSEALPADERRYIFEATSVVAADWSGRISADRWVRVLYADGELDLRGPPSVIFNAFTRFARYRDWTPQIHVDQQWLTVRAGGVGSQFLLWEKPGDRHVQHYGVVTELERDRRFTWRAPFAEWGKVFLGTSMRMEARGNDGARIYHVLYVDMPEEYLPIFAGFGSLHGLDLEFETFHIFEEARGLQALLDAGALHGEASEYLFSASKEVARSWPMQEGRAWPVEAATIRPGRTITFEDAVLEIAQRLSTVIPPPSYFRRYRDRARSLRFHPELRRG